MQKFMPKALPLSQFEHGVSREKAPVEEGLHLCFMQYVQPESRFCIEFGARDGTTAHTRHLVDNHGFSALYIEGDPGAAARLAKNFAANEKVTAIQSFITAENIQALFDKAGTPERPYILTIDIDGNDYYVWKAIDRYRPVFVCVEYNASYGPASDFIIDYNPEFHWQKDDYFGAAIKPFVELARAKGYELIHVSSAGDNLFFVDREYFPVFNIKDNSPEFMYQLPQYGRYGRAPNGKGHPASRLNTSLWHRALLRIRYWLRSPVRKRVKQIMKRKYLENRERSHAWAK